MARMVVQRSGVAGKGKTWFSGRTAWSNWC